jgi:hypothetical protein
MEAGGEIGELEAQLDKITGDVKTKAGNIGLWLLNLNSLVVAMKAEEERFRARRKPVEALIERIKGYVKGCLETAQIDKIQLPAVTISIAKCPPSVEVLDEAKIPPEYIRVIQETQVDKQNILIAWKNGKEVPGTALVTDKTTLRIK